MQTSCFSKLEMPQSLERRETLRYLCPGPELYPYLRLDTGMDIRSLLRIGLRRASYQGTALAVPREAGS